MTTKLLSIADLRTDGGTQLRVRIDEQHVDDLAQAYIDKEASDAVPPIEVLFDSATYWVWDGNHRILAAQKAGRDKIKCHVEKGTQREAILKAAGANDKHGLKRSNLDKRKAIGTLLADKDWSKRSNAWIARACCVDDHTVEAVKASTAFEHRKSDVETVECEDGKVRPARRHRHKPDLPDPDSFPAADDVERIPRDTAGEPGSSTQVGLEPTPAVSFDSDDNPASDAAILKPQPPAAADRGGASSQFDWWTERLGWLADKWRAQFSDECDTAACISAIKNFVKTIER